MRPDAVERRAHGFRGAVGGAAHAPIGVARRHHEGGEVERFPGDFRRLDLGDAFGAPALVVERGVFGEQRGIRRVGKDHALRGVRGLGADQHGPHHALARQPRRGRQHARVASLREGDGLFQLAGPLDGPRHEESCRFRNCRHVPRI